MIYNITPVPKPRMTQSDKWKKRKCVVQYWQYKDKLKESGMSLTNDDRVIFYVPMPDSYSKKKKALLDGQPHQQKPDVDNMIKGILDCLFKDDSHIWRVYAEKRWAYEGAIEIVPINK